MDDRRSYLGSLGALISVTLAGCLDDLNPGEDDEELTEAQLEMLDKYEEGHTEFEYAIEDFERGEELYEKEDYSEAERYFRDAERGFESASDQIGNAERILNEIDDRGKTDEAETKIEDAWEISMTFYAAADTHRDAAVDAQENPMMGDMYFDASQETIEQEASTRSIPDNLDIISAMTVSEDE